MGGLIMPNRSHEEVNFTAHILDAMGLSCTTERVLQALDAGASDGLWDARIDLENDCVLLQSVVVGGW